MSVPIMSNNNHTPDTTAANQPTQEMRSNPQMGRYVPILATVPAPADPEVSARPVRRKFTAPYKLRIVNEADACTQSGEVGALLRREGLYSSHLTDWRRQQQQQNPGARKGSRPVSDGRMAAENRELRCKTRQLERQLAQAEAIVELQKKVSSLLGITARVRASAHDLSTLESDENV